MYRLGVVGRHTDRILQTYALIKYIDINISIEPISETHSVVMTCGYVSRAAFNVECGTHVLSDSNSRVEIFLG